MDSESWLRDEIGRMEDARIQLAWVLEEWQQAASLPLLQQTLAEQRAVNASVAEHLGRIAAALGVPAAPVESPAARGLVAEARAVVRAVSEDARDAAIAAHATRIELWEIGSYETLHRLFRLALQDEAADQIEALLGELREAERHLASLAPAFGDEEPSTALHGAGHRQRSIGLGRGPTS